MKSGKKIIIGARGSQLSLVQSELVKSLLQKLVPNTEVSIKVIKTTGDKNLNPIPLDSVGKGWFTKEIDKELLAGNIDLAVHSLKDIPEILPEGLSLVAVLEREDAREVLISKKNIPFSKLRKGAVIGTDSTRRQSQLLHKRPDLIIKSMRGNVPTRIKKLDGMEYDAIILAAAGLIRLGLQDKITEYFSLDDFIPSPGQGALALVIKKTNNSIAELLQKLNHEQTRKVVTVERAFSKAVGGGCKMPVGAYAEIQNDKMTLYGMFGSLDGKNVMKEMIRGDSTDLGKKLARQMLDVSTSWYKISNQLENVIVITRPTTDNQSLKEKLEKSGYKVFALPTITTAGNYANKTVQQALSQLAEFDWILFTSVKGVHYFMHYLHEKKIDKKIVKTQKIAAVGSQTAEAIKSYDLPVHFIPSTFTTNDLGRELTNIKGQKLLLARSHIANPALVKMLEDKGAIVTNIPMYKTNYTPNNIEDFLELVLQNKIQYITFTSPSTVTGFMKNIQGSELLKTILTIPLLSIGPVTTKKASQYGFVNIITAETHTTDGMIKKLGVLMSSRA